VDGGAACIVRIHVMSYRPHLDWFDAAEARGMTLDDPIFTIGVACDLPSLDLASCSARVLEVVAADDSVASGL
jgi:hypothetical protein